MPITGTCKLCLREDIPLEMSHFVSRKLYYSGKKPMECVNLLETTRDIEELEYPLLCGDCEDRFDRNGESEVLKHVAPKAVLRMKLAVPRDTDPTAPRFYAPDFDIDTEKFAYFALSIIWRRTIHEWHPSIWRLELGDFAEQMRRYLLGETNFPSNMSVVLMVCSDEYSRRIWTVPTEIMELGSLDYAFDVRGIRFRVIMGHLLPLARGWDCRGPLKPIFLADCERRARQTWENTKTAQAAHQTPRT
jgi:hypothetical protein